MKRLHLFELHDFEWFPSFLREYITDFLSFYSYHVNPYKPVLKKLDSAMKKINCTHILDLCSGNGLYMLRILKYLNNKNINITLTDKYPEIKSFELIKVLSKGKINYIKNSINAENVPSGLKGFRTLFSSFHHFKPDTAHKIIHDTVKERQGIAVSEFLNRNIFTAITASLGGVFLLLLLTPLINPFSLKRIFWTYLIPIVPLVVFWDSFVSHLRCYTVEELENFVTDLKDDYCWEIGKAKSIFGLCEVTYMIGYPKEKTI